MMVQIQEEIRRGKELRERDVMIDWERAKRAGCPERKWRARPQFPSFLTSKKDVPKSRVHFLKIDKRNTTNTNLDARSPTVPSKSLTKAPSSEKVGVTRMRKQLNKEGTRFRNRRSDLNLDWNCPGFPFCYLGWERTVGLLHSRCTAWHILIIGVVTF